MTETNAERLKCADKFLKDLSAEGDGIGLHGQTLELVGWLIEQAVQSQKLEKSIQKAIEMQEYYLVTNHNLQMENQRFIEVLKFYANENNHEAPHNVEPLIDMDGGYKARQALEGVSNGD